ncbi:MAG TPA: PIG-L family deacetylase [Pirellulaceae bacterium]|nr:PIG-L family deacetylase [Pirellulaceae bacterium]
MSRLLVLGAHPDDAEYHAGGLTSIYRSLGRTVRWISATDGSAGHHLLHGPELVARRRREAAASAARASVEHQVWDFPDAHLVADLDLRQRVIREIRTFRPDLVLTHRPWDYHPDHRALGQAVMDACYLVTVPGLMRDVPPLERDPVVAYLADPFRKPIEFRPDRILDVTDRIDAIVSLLAEHESQFFEFLPVSFGSPEPLPSDPNERPAWLKRWFLARTAWRAERWSPGGGERLIEAFELAEHAAGADPALLDHLFPGSRKPG